MRVFAISASVATILETMVPKALADALRDDSTELETLRLGYCGPTKKHHPYGKLDLSGNVNVGGAGSALMAFLQSLLSDRRG